MIHFTSSEVSTIEQQTHRIKNNTIPTTISSIVYVNSEMFCRCFIVEPLFALFTKVLLLIVRYIVFFHLLRITIWANQEPIIHLTFQGTLGHYCHRGEN
jgi:hypothetical protein